MSPRGMVSIDVRVELSIVALSQVSIDVVEVVSIDDVRFSLRIERFKRAGSEKMCNSSLFLLLLIVGHKICLAHIMASPPIDGKGAPSIDGKGSPSIDSPSFPRQFPLARQTDHSSLCTQKAPKDTKITTFLQIVHNLSGDSVSIDVRGGISIDVGWVWAFEGRVVSVDNGRRVSFDEQVLLSIDVLRLPLRMVRSRSAGSEKRSVCSLLLLVLLGMHLKTQ
ncbi:hypothetical protein DY000_02040075 [Brassica cretica]|uniref:Uncharacterized protein n=1 Tax=Brassica cretica TaxID=69181 RepID=A0ABQ7BA10_BRACR|nr:hypothetical protein DY000_02040075 [Brassica cretica]